MHGGDLWLADTQDCKIYRMDPDGGEVRAQIQAPEPELHGMTLHEGQIWFCCATTRRVCSVELPG